MEPCPTEGCFELFQSILPKEFLLSLEKKERRRGIYPVSLVAWLLIYQRLEGGRSLQEALRSVMIGYWRELNGDSLRVKKGQISDSTCGYSKARQKFSLEAAEEIADKLFDSLSAEEFGSPIGKRLIALDGTTISLSADESLRSKYPPGRNQNGNSRNGLLHVLVTHDLISGYAGRPFYAPYYGKDAESEAELTKRAIEHLPDDAVYVLDRGFGIFSVCNAFASTRRDLVVRLQENRGRKVLGRVPKRGTDQKVSWTPSDIDRKTNPEISANAKVEGRIICERIRTREGKVQTLILFTTLLNLTPKEIIKIYGLRWNIETDLRTLKKTVNLERLDAKDPDMVAKELIMGICAYNLIRALIARTAKQTGLSPRDFSFTTMLGIVRDGMPLLYAAESNEKKLWYLDKINHLAKCAVLKKRLTRHAANRGTVL